MKVVLSQKDIVDAIGDWLFSNRALNIVEKSLTMDSTTNEITVEVED